MKTKRIGEWIEITIPQKWQGYTIERIMKKELLVPRKLLHKFRSERSVTLNNESKHWKQTHVEAGDRLRIQVFAPQELEVVPTFMDIDIVYEDDHLLVINKPVGIDTHPNQPDQTNTLVNAAAFYFQMNGIEATPKYVHRLDRDTSGAILFAKHELAIATLGQQLKERKIKRTYIAWAHGKVKLKKGTIDQPIGKDRHHPVRRRVSKGGQPAETNYEVLDYDPKRKASLLKLQLNTGRTHQIRVHLSFIGHPLLGDTLYGGDAHTSYKQALHAAKLSFIHPFTEENIECLAMPPKDTPLFKEEHVRSLE
ncbi:pseudouridine synthase [Halobacillus andaensis]|uniref:Pseudouridine synthase n=1 Tax=Halobacillus andaensis TaxID=1176239 RepID=A0A917EX35_HALAA|nr:RluA family pseudouridine synthase [Halobacillus andaensis]MBP2005982.1 23S rRNA pseudouridine1911/1915/1917 synthase [Halobacillus andaensis]GGF24537.1 pseudouridine synthase [Halobacillus andaensis]